MLNHKSNAGSLSLLTFAFVNQKAAGSSEVNRVVNLQALQVLTHLPTLWKLRINVFEVNLEAHTIRRNSSKTVQLYF